jgi:hypothetical protein
MMQQGALCVFYVTANAIDHYTGGTLNGANILDSYANCENLSHQSWDNLYDHGIYSPEALFSDFLQYRQTNNVIGSLLRGYPVAAYIHQDGCDENGKEYVGLHEVLITGFSYFYSGPMAGFNYTFFNSQINDYQNLPPSDFWDTQEIYGVQ